MTCCRHGSFGSMEERASTKEYARKFLAAINGLEGKPAQLVMAKITGNFKRGNERAGVKS